MAEVYEVKAAAQGRWPEILATVGGIPPEYLNPKIEHPCPKCGGKTRFRLINEDAGAVFCNHCFDKDNGDGIAAIKWACGTDFPGAMRLLENHLGLTCDSSQVKRPTPTSKTNGSNKPTKTYQTVDDAIAAMQSNMGEASQRYDYPNTKGELVLVVLRWDQGDGEKTFRQISKHSGKWVLKGVEGKNPIYNSQAVIDCQDIVFLVEGEKAANALQAVGLIATTSPGGCKSGDKADWNLLANKDVCILPDNDDVGRKYAQEVGKQLFELKQPARMKLIELPGLSEAGDVVDWLDLHDAAEPDDLAAQLRDMADSAEEWFPEGVEPPIRVIGLDDLFENHPSLSPYIIDGLLRSGEVANIVSGAKVGKSWLVYGLAYAVASGKRWLGHFPTKQTRVLVIDNELHQPVLSHRLQAVADAMGILPYERGDRLEVMSLRGRLKNLYDIERMSRDWGEKYGLIICDAFYRVLPTDMDENSNGDITKAFNLLDSIAQRTGVAWINIHHTSKGFQGGKAVTDIGSGAGAQSRAADAHIVLREHEDENCAVLEAAVRSFAPVDPLPIRWEFPLWTSDHDIDAKAVKGRLTSQERKQREKDEQGKQSILDALQRDGRLSARRLRAASGVKSPDRIDRLTYQLCQEGLIVEHDVVICGRDAKEYEAREGITSDSGEWSGGRFTPPPTLPLEG